MTKEQRIAQVQQDLNQILHNLDKDESNGYICYASFDLVYEAISKLQKEIEESSVVLAAFSDYEFRRK